MIVPERLHSIDAVRAFALLSGIVLHATMSFLPGFGTTGFPIIDRSPSIALGLLFFVIHSFRMSLFFFIAGYFAHMQFHRHGLRHFLKDRGKRIALPLLIGWPILCPLVILPIVLAAIQQPTGVSQPPPPPTSAPLAFPLLHLWFLYLLLVLYCVVLTARAGCVYAFDRSGQGRLFLDRCVRGIMSNSWGVIVLALPAAVGFLLYPYWVPWMGIPTPDYSLIPNSPAFIAFFTAFSFGWLLHRQPELLSLWRDRWKFYLSLAIGLSVAALTIAGPLPKFTLVESGKPTLVYAACYALSTWCWIVALMGVGLQFFSAPSHRLRYLADSSYWLYLIHLPMVFLAQTAVMSWNIHWSLKFPLILLGTLPLMLLSYHYCVRSTFIGGLLNGRRYPRTINHTT